MSWLSYTVLDAALGYIDTNTENLYICSQEPTTFAGASSTYKLGVKATPEILAPSDRSGGGREITVSAITDGSVTATGTATPFAITDDSASLLLATGSLSASQVVTANNSFSLTAITVGIPDPA